MFLLYVLAVFSIADLVWAVWAWRRLAGWWRVGAMVFLLGQIAALGVWVLSRYHAAGWDAYLPRPVNSAVLVWHLTVVLPWLLWRLAAGLVALARWLAGLGRKKLPPAEVSPGGGMSRREFFRTTATLAPPLITVAASGVGEAQLDGFRIRRLTVPLPGLPPQLDGVTVAQLSDTHIGRFTRGRVVERFVEEINRLDADLVVLTGDLINDSLRALPAALEMARGLRARAGVFACEGNHDLIEDGRRFRRECEKGGLPLLVGDAATTTLRGEKIQVLGLPWARGDSEHAELLNRLRSRRDASAWPLLLAHHPHAWDATDGEFPLTFAGHTHGGQLMASAGVGFGPWMYRYWSGLYTREDRALIVSNGAGNWFPVRIQAPAEIIHVTLRAAARG